MSKFDDELDKMRQLALDQQSASAESWNWSDWEKSSAAFLKNWKAPKGTSISITSLLVI